MHIYYAIGQDKITHDISRSLFRRALAEYLKEASGCEAVGEPEGGVVHRLESVMVHELSDGASGAACEGVSDGAKGLVAQGLDVSGGAANDGLDGEVESVMVHELGDGASGVTCEGLGYELEGVVVHELGDGSGCNETDIVSVLMDSIAENEHGKPYFNYSAAQHFSISHTGSRTGSCTESCTGNHTINEEGKTCSVCSGMPYLSTESVAGESDMLPSNCSAAPHFSISHTENVWVALFNNMPCGIDAQRERRVRYDNIASKYFSAEAQERLDGLDEDAKKKQFCIEWARYEALVKAIGTTVFSKQVWEDANRDGWKIVDVEIPELGPDVHVAICSCDVEVDREGGSNHSYRDRSKVGSKKKLAKQRSAYELGARYLGTQMRTEAEVRKHLEDKECDPKEIEETIQEFKLHRYIDDEHYSYIYAEKAVAKGRGINRIVAELANRGVDAEVARNTIEDFIYENGISERAMAHEVARKVAEAETSSGRELDQRMLAKIGRKLDGLGYSSSLIYGIIDEIRREYSATWEEE